MSELTLNKVGFADSPPALAQGQTGMVVCSKQLQQDTKVKLENIVL